MALVADGMGGYQAGEIASSMASEQIRSEMSRWLSQVTGEHVGAQAVARALEHCVENANLAILRAAHENSEFAGMGTTLVVGVFLRGRLVLGHIGDSRCYRFRQGQLRLLTRDHSLLQEQIDAGLISVEEAASSLQRNLVTRALGVELSVLLDVTEQVVQVDDIFLMCSDGLTDMVAEQEIADILNFPVALESKAQKLIDAANSHGGRDNIGVLLIHAATDFKKTTIMSRLLGR
jgi:protein phosphatase